MADDVVQIDIEVSTHSEKEINDLLNKIDRGEQKLSTIKEKKRRVQSLRGGGAPADIGFGQEEEDRGGIFGGQIEGEALPGGKPRDTKSKEAVQTENQFKETQKRVSNIEKVMGLGQNVGTGLSFLTAKGGDPVQTVFTALSKIPGFIQVVAGILIAKGIVEFIIEELFRDGGIFDRRFVRKLEKEVTNLTTRKEKAQINAGMRAIISTTQQGLRGGQYQFTNSQSFANRGGVYTRDLESIAKGVTP